MSKSPPSSQDPMEVRKVITDYIKEKSKIDTDTLIKMINDAKFEHWVHVGLVMEALAKKEPSAISNDDFVKTLNAIGLKNDTNGLKDDTKKSCIGYLFKERISEINELDAEKMIKDLKISDPEVSKSIIDYYNLQVNSIKPKIGKADKEVLGSVSLYITDIKQDERFDIDINQADQARAVIKKINKLVSIDIDHFIQIVKSSGIESDFYKAHCIGKLFDEIPTTLDQVNKIIKGVGIENEEIKKLVKEEWGISEEYNKNQKLGENDYAFKDIKRYLANSPQINLKELIKKINDANFSHEYKLPIIEILAKKNLSLINTDTFLEILESVGIREQKDKADCIEVLFEKRVGEINPNDAIKIIEKAGIKDADTVTNLKTVYIDKLKEALNSVLNFSEKLTNIDKSKAIKIKKILYDLGRYNLSETKLAGIAEKEEESSKNSQQTIPESEKPKSLLRPTSSFQVKSTSRNNSSGSDSSGEFLV